MELNLSEENELQLQAYLKFAKQKRCAGGRAGMRRACARLPRPAAALLDPWLP